ncbi:MAG: DNA gyrase inhibitor YacG [Candidatus Rokuibacteriota bacterium]|nr:MAG: DNA gyrase inhibitor YacG [Candidatus Rokubacteria bacterium]
MRALVRFEPGRTTRPSPAGAPAPWEGNAHRPFCSITCRLVDLDVWHDEGYRVPAHEDDNVP